MLVAEHIHHVLKLLKANSAIAIDVDFAHELLETLLLEGVTLHSEHLSYLVEVDLAVAVTVQEVVRFLQAIFVENFALVHCRCAPLFELNGPIVIHINLLENSISLI